MKYTKKDICMIIPTYNRAEDLEKGINFIINNKNIPGKLIIVDQSKDSKTKDMVKRYSKKNKFIQYVYSDVPSSSIALNKGIEIAIKEFELVLTTADDVEFLPGFLDTILKEFNVNKKAVCVGMVERPSSEFNSSWIKRLENAFIEFCLLPSKGPRLKVTGPYGTGGITVEGKTLRDCQWLPGFVLCCKRKAYRDYRMPPRWGYNVLEDIDSTYTIYKKFGKGSVVSIGDRKAIHRTSFEERYVGKKKIFVNHEDHFAFYYRHFHNPLGTMKLIWELFWILVLNFIRMIFKPNKENYLKNIGLWQALRYCISNRHRIKNGESRLFLNPDLSMKDNF